MKRNILDYLGNVIGELELPDDTAENVWQEKLARYAQPPADVVVPDLTPRQVRQALVLSGVPLESIDAAIAQLPEPHKTLAHIEWEYSVAFKRSNPLIGQVAALLGWNNAQLTAMWDLAKGL